MEKFKFNFGEGLSPKKTYVLDKKGSRQKEQQRISLLQKHVKDKKKVQAILEDIEKNHNWSWYREMYDRHKNNLDFLALTYRYDTKISYGQMFERATAMAKTLKAMGIKKGMNIPMCAANTPEMVEMLLAISMVGARFTMFGDDFDLDYIQEIVARCGNDVLFISSDDKYGKIKDIIDDFNFQNKLVISLTDSLQDGIDYFDKWDDEFYKFENKVYDFKRKDPNVLSVDEFVKYGNMYIGEVVDTTVGLDDVFATTFSSGSTKTGRPKAIVHTNRSFVTMARFHDTDISGLPEMRNMISLAHIPPHSNTDLITCISDVFSQKCAVACEPIYDEHFFAKALIINQADYVAAPTSMWIQGLKDFRDKEELKDYDLSFLKLPAAVGEPMSPGEEKFINRELKKQKAGTKKLPFPLAPVKISFGGGDCEHGGLYFTLFKQLREAITFPREDYGIKPFQSVNVTALRPDGTECDFYELGRLVANSPGTMQYYDNNEEATKKFFIKDAYGNTWADHGVWGYINSYGNPLMKGRMGDEFTLSNGIKVPTFVIADEILKDTKNIMSCSVVNVKDEDGEEIPVAHIELQPDKKKSESNALMSAEERLQNYLPDELADKVVYRVHSYEEGFPLTGCRKRKHLALEEEGLTAACIKPRICEVYDSSGKEICVYYDKPYQTDHKKFDNKLYIKIVLKK